MSTGILPRSERFQNFQGLLEELKGGADPAHALTRLYNGMTGVISKAEVEIRRLRDVADSLTAELAALKAAGLEVRYYFPKVTKADLN